MRCRSAWNCVSCVRSGVPAGTKYGGRSSGAGARRRSSPACASATICLRCSDADDVVERALVDRQARVVARRKLLAQVLRASSRGRCAWIWGRGVITSSTVTCVEVEAGWRASSGACRGSTGPRAPASGSPPATACRRRPPAGGCAAACSSPCTNRLTKLTIHVTGGLSSGASAYETYGAMRSAWAAPITLGVISETTRISERDRDGARRQRELAPRRTGAR